MCIRDRSKAVSADKVQSVESHKHQNLSKDIVSVTHNPFAAYAYKPSEFTGTDVENLSMHELHVLADDLRNEIKNAEYAGSNNVSSWLMLSAVNNELARQSLDALATHINETDLNETLQDQNNHLSVSDLNLMAENTDLSLEVRLAAQFFLDNAARRDQLDFTNKNEAK